MDLAKGKKPFIGDHEVEDVKDADMLRKKDAEERDELSRRLVEKDRFGKSKISKHSMNGIALTEEEKLRIMPDLKLQSRMKYLEKREKETLEKVKAVLKDEREIFDNSELTLRELKMRHLREKITAYAEKNTVETKREGEYRLP